MENGLFLVHLALLLASLSFSAHASEEPDGATMRLEELDEQIAEISARHGIFSTSLFDPLMEAADIRIQKGFIEEARNNLQQAQNISHRTEGVYSLKQLEAVHLLSKISVLEEDYRLANRQKKFAHFVSTHALEPDDPAYFNAYVELSQWYLATDQARRARLLLTEAMQIAEEQGMNLLPWQVMISRTRRIEGLCCKTDVLTAQLPGYNKMPANPEILREAYLELADLLTLDRKPDQAADYYRKAWALGTGETSAQPHPISVRRSLDANRNRYVDTYKVQTDHRVHRDTLRRLSEKELLEEDSLEPQWFLLDAEGFQAGLDVPDQHETSDFRKRTKRTRGAPLVFNEEQLDNLLSLRWLNRRDDIVIKLIFTVMETGDLQDITIVESNAPNKLNRLVLDALRKVYFRPAVIDGYPIRFEDYRFTQTFRSAVDS